MSETITFNRLLLDDASLHNIICQLLLAVSYTFYQKSSLIVILSNICLTNIVRGETLKDCEEMFADVIVASFPVDLYKSQDQSRTFSVIFSKFTENERWSCPFLINSH